MKPRVLLSVCLAALVVVAGCAETKITNSRSELAGRKLARPGRIVVEDFAATAGDMSAASRDTAAGYGDAGSVSAEQLRAGRELGALVAARLVENIDAMGLAAVRASSAAPLREGDILIAGHFASVEEGSTAKRMIVGFGSGKAEVTTFVQGYLMTKNGLRKLGSGTVEAGGGKGPGLLVPLAVTAATSNPIGLLVGGALKAGGEASGHSKAEGAAKRTADVISERLKQRFQEQGWI